MKRPVLCRLLLHRWRASASMKDLIICDRCGVKFPNGAGSVPPR